MWSKVWREDRQFCGQVEAPRYPDIVHVLSLVSMHVRARHCQVGSTGSYARRGARGARTTGHECGRGRFNEFRVTRTRET